MNAKAARKLRQAARDATVGKQASGYQRGRETIIKAVALLATGIERKAAVKHTTLKVHPDTTRGVYHALKQGRDLKH